MPLIRKRRIWWEQVSGVASYVVYASQDQNAFDHNNFQWEATPGTVYKKVPNGKNEMVIPDEWPEFPSQEGTYYIGITSQDEVGNQSDPFVSSAAFKFAAPSAPQKGGIESS